ncbi:uncharacterized protein LOC143887793 isoform X2 [Tasmannia lanceolata]|uniref:uncharacterized protein LOC143887793 isoform X2 n=1 Tax=Tasmannia lanceolata TaxID=3420 RepID=UPI00406453B8
MVKGITCMAGGIDGTALDSICISGYPIEQFITHKNKIVNGNEESMTDLGCALDSANQCTQRGLNKDLGAGANAGPRAGMRYVTTNPLSELVWSPHSGLILKCADCSLSEKKSTHLLDTDSSNIIIPPQQSIKARVSDNNGTLADGTLGSMKPPPILESETSNRVIFVQYPRSPLGISPLCQSRDQEKTCGDVDQFPKKMEVSCVDTNNYEDDYSSNKDMGISSLSDTKKNVDIFQLREDIVTTFPEKPYVPGLENGRSTKVRDILAGVDNRGGANSSLFKLEEIRPDLDPECGVFTIQPLLTRENNIQPLQTVGMFCSQRSSKKAVAEGVNSCAEVGTILASQTKDEGKDIPEQNKWILSFDRESLVEYAPNKCKSPLNRNKDKGKALYDTEINQSILNEVDESHESDESCNSRRLYSTGKRAWSFEQQGIVKSKKIKKQHHKSSRSASFVGKDSSFLNWISNMVKGLSKFDADDTPPLALPGEAYQKSHDSHSSEQDKNQGDPDCRSTGFRNIFQALYCSSLKEQDKNDGNVDRQTGAKGSKDLEMAGRMQCDHGNIHIASDEESMKLNLSISNEMSKKPESNIGENLNSCNIACGFETGGMSSRNSSFEKDFGSPSEGKMAGRVVSVDPNRLSSSVNIKNNPLESLWITRFCPKASATMLDLVKGNHNSTAVFEDNLEDGHEPSIEDQRKGVSKNMQNNMITATASYSSKGTVVESDQKLKSKFSPILPTQRLKYSEAMASIFARRLDALKHITPSKVGDNGTHATTMCFFCGMKGHTLRDCSHIIGSDIESIIKNVNLCDVSKESSLCIRCFQFNHWAVACPYASSRRQTHLDCNASLGGIENCGRMQHNSGNQTLFINHDGINLLQSQNKDVQHQFFTAYTISHKENSRVGGEFMLCTNVNKKLSRSMIHDGLVSKDFQGDEIPAVPRGFFETIKRLRLSRTDILKWMRSPTSDFRVEGFFVRLRLGNWEDGLGGTGYHVACISGKTCNIGTFSI